MNISHWIIVICVVISSASFGRSDSKSSSIETWESLLKQKGENLVFDVYGTSGPQWPKNPERTADQENIRQILARAVIHDARKLVHSLATSSEKKVWSRIDACLRIRDDVLRDDSYVDLVLADALTRAAAVALCKRLGSEDHTSQAFQESLARLPVDGFFIAKWIALARSEFGFSADAFADVDQAETEEEAFKLFWDAISSNEDIGLPSNMVKSGSLDLLKAPNLPLLFHRIIRTDIIVKTLAVASKYKSQASEFSLNDSEEKIARVIPAPISQTRYSIRVNSVQKKYTPLDSNKYTIGERVLGLQVSYPEVARLLQAIGSKNIEKQLFYDVSDVLPSQTE